MLVIDFGLIPGYKFTVDFGNGTPTSFQEVILPESEVEIIEYRNGSDILSNSKKIPGRAKYTNLILKRGLIQSTELYAWFKQTKRGIPEFRDITVNILNKENEPFSTWKLSGCWPTKYYGPSLNATKNEILIETVEIVTQDIDIEIH